MRYLALAEVLELHRMVIEETGGSHGLRDLGALESAVAQPRMTFGGQDLYPAVEEKAATLGFSLICNHPFIDGNKRAGHAAMESFLVLNGCELEADVDEAEQVVLGIAAGQRSRQSFVDWIRKHVKPLPQPRGDLLPP